MESKGARALCNKDIYRRNNFFSQIGTEWPLAVHNSSADFASNIMKTWERFS